MVKVLGLLLIILSISAYSKHSDHKSDQIAPSGFLNLNSGTVFLERENPGTPVTQEDLDNLWEFAISVEEESDQS